MRPRPQIIEDCRPLAEFHPDAGQRRKLHHTFAHDFLPAFFFRDAAQIVHAESAVDPTIHAQSHWHAMEISLGLAAPVSSDTDFKFRRVTDLRASRERIGNHAALVIEMPPPEWPALAWFIALVCVDEPGSDAHNSSGRYLTFERLSDSGETRQAVVCEHTDDGQHLNYGLAAEASRATFISLATRVVGDTLDDNREQCSP